MSLARRRQRGLSVVELLVGVAVGLFLVAGAVTLFVSNLGNSRQMLLEARVNQDMRAAADLIARDLRRAAYWGNSLSGTVTTGSATTVNPYREIVVGTDSIEFQFSRDASGSEDNTVGNNEYSGFRLSTDGVTGNGVVQMRLGGVATYQTITDPQTINVTGLTIGTSVTPVDIADACSRTCCNAADVAAGTRGCTAVTLSSGNCPTISVRRYRLALTAQANGNSQISRTLNTSVRARNDEFAGACPT